MDAIPVSTYPTSRQVNEKIVDVLLEAINPLGV